MTTRRSRDCTASLKLKASTNRPTRRIRGNPENSPAGWLRARLGWWTDAAGAVRPSHTAQLATAAATHRRRLAGQRAAAEAAAGSAATPAQRREHLAAIRATLAERRRPA